MAGLQTKYEIAEIYKRDQEPALHSKRKLFPDKIKTIHGGSLMYLILFFIRNFHIN